MGQSDRTMVDEDRTCIWYCAYIVLNGFYLMAVKYGSRIHVLALVQRFQVLHLLLLNPFLCNYKQHKIYVYFLLSKKFLRSSLVVLEYFCSLGLCVHLQTFSNLCLLLCFWYLYGLWFSISDLLAFFSPSFILTNNIG